MHTCMRERERERELHHIKVNQKSIKFLTSKQRICFISKIEGPIITYDLARLTVEQGPNGRNCCSIKRVLTRRKDLQSKLTVKININGWIAKQN